ncbi:MAG TPA: endonuclease/exonuclease/phosphatase family protein [Phycisphaerales bacterium]|nr:endonuclease/exonuclease/phosphatase family protein [Phycisphaerales bacterium]
MRALISTILATLTFLLPACVPAQERVAAESPAQVRILSWNIWHGGREDGLEAGPRKVIDVIREADADIVAMQETYGSGEAIADALGFQLHARGTNVSLHSRYPIVEDISVFEPFKCVGGLIEVPEGSGVRQIAVYSLWLPYDKEIWEVGTRPTGDRDAMLAACASSAHDLELIRDAIRTRLGDARYADVPVILAGDFNSMSHMDYTEAAREQYRDVIEWPTSRVLTDAGYRDVYRQLHPRVDRMTDRTWTPRFPAQEQDRIDFVYVRGDVTPLAARVIDVHRDGFPSDHAALLATISLTPEQPIDELRVVSYNIRHGRGMDDQVDLTRTASVLRSLAPDVIGLQEVDLNVQRSGRLNEPRELAELMAEGGAAPFHAAFGAFMPLQGGHYGMAILSRYPIVRAWPIELPVGNEPRVALAARILPPGRAPITIINVHLDWVDDDAFRYAQARVVAQALQNLDTPYILLGDFNDQKGSRTLDLFSSTLMEIGKVDDNGRPAGGADRFTFSSTRPEVEIDFVMAGPRACWERADTSGYPLVYVRNLPVPINTCRVVEEPQASDHRPVVARIALPDCLQQSN